MDDLARALVLQDELTRAFGQPNGPSDSERRMARALAPGEPPAPGIPPAILNAPAQNTEPGESLPGWLRLAGNIGRMVGNPAAAGAAFAPVVEGTVSGTVDRMKQLDDALWGRQGMTDEDIVGFSADMAGLASTGGLAMPAVRGGLGMGIRAYHGSPQSTKLANMVDEYQGQHSSPGRESGSPLHDVTANGIYPADFYSPEGRRYYGTGADDLDAAAYQKIVAMRNNPDALVKVWRAVPWDGKGKRPTSFGGQHLNPGDWVTISRQYAIDHGESALNGNYALIATNKPARELYTAGDSFLEWGWEPTPDAK